MKAKTKKADIKVEKVESLYYPVRISFHEVKGLITRNLLIRADLNLMEVGAILVASIGAAFEHMWLFRDRDFQYVDRSWIDDFPMFNYRDYELYTLADLHLTKAGKCSFTYDTGDDYTFDVFVKEPILKAGRQVAYVLKGKGAFILEDNIMMLYDYVENGTPIDFDQVWFCPYPVSTMEEYLGPLSKEDCEDMFYGIDEDVLGYLGVQMHEGWSSTGGGDA